MSRKTTHAHPTPHMKLAQHTPGKYETDQPSVQGRAQKLQILANQAQNQPKWSLTPIPSPKAAPHSCNPWWWVKRTPNFANFTRLLGFSG